MHIIQVLLSTALPHTIEPNASSESHQHDKASAKHVRNRAKEMEDFIRISRLFMLLSVGSLSILLHCTVHTFPQAIRAVGIL